MSATAKRFCRLLPPTTPPFDPEEMEQLGLMMDRQVNRAGKRPPPAAFTYFGQFIDHDLVEDDTRFARAGKKEPAQTVNRGGGRLDLHHVYGRGPFSRRDARLYDGAYFRLGEVTTHGERFDLPLDGRGHPICADARSRENFILRQISVLFMKLHNLAVAEQPAFLGNARFAPAREKVVWQYQWLVMRNFLRLVMKASEFQRLTKGATPTIDWQGAFAVPVEFSQAVFRFGHSMVRPSYLLRPGAEAVELRTIFAGSHRNAPLQEKDAINWRFFFRSATTAMSIDTIIAPPLFRLPDVPMKHGNAGHPPILPSELPVRTLVRGAKTGLPTGEEMAQAFGLVPLAAPRDGLDASDPWLPLQWLGMAGRTPLWYYVLLEAEIEGEGVTLGSLGSRFIGEVVEASLRADPDCYLSRFAGKRPPSWKTATNPKMKIDTLQDLAAAVGL